MTQLEVSIEDEVVKWAKKNKFLTPKVRFTEAGYPDRLFVSPYGHTIFIEFKKPGEEPSPLQYHRLSELTKRGVPATWCDNVLEAIGILKSSLETAVDAASVPEESDPTTVVTGIRRAISRPRTGEDVNGPGSVQDPEGERTEQEDAHNRPIEASPESVARRDQEVGGLSRIILLNPTRRR